VNDLISEAINNKSKKPLRSQLGPTATVTITVKSKAFLVLIWIGLAVGVGFWLASETVAPQVSSSSNSTTTPDERLASKIPQNSPIDSISSGSERNAEIAKVIQATNSDDLLMLAVGESFSLVVESKGSNSLVLLKVISVISEPNYTQIQGRSSDGTVAIVTVSSSLTRIMIKTADKVFEYAGADFDGTVKQLVELNLADDIYSAELNMTPIPQTFTPERIFER
jgi:hypothetical protein